MRITPSCSSSSSSTPMEELPPQHLPHEAYFSSQERAQDCQRGDELWFEDGNLILQAEKTLFKIYRGHLAARSSVFRDMFSFPAPPEGNLTLDGCPIIQVYDSAEDMSRFLRALLDSEYFEPPPIQTTLSLVTSILRLATKYDVKYLRARALNHLTSTYPTTLSAWKGRDATRSIPSIENTPFAALQLASEFDLPWIVPAIIYCISSHDLFKTLDGTDWDGGKVELSWAEKRMCVQGRNKIMLIQNAHALNVVKHAVEEEERYKCTTPDTNACSQTRLRIASLLTRWGTAGFLDFFDEQYQAFAGESSGASGGGRFCPGCLEWFRVGQERAVREMWNGLPENMELPPWEELERLRGLAMA